MKTHIARKRFGQNFLQDPQVIYDILHTVNARSDDTVVEIGPGLGALTVPLLDRLPHLHVVEIDRDLIQRLEKKWPPERLTIHAGDALQFDFGTIGNRLRILGNLPYNISTPLLFHLASFGDQIDDMHFMLQKEVVDRMVAEPNTPDYGRLSVMLQSRFWIDKILDVPPEAFDPAPKVDSAVVRLIPMDHPPSPDLMNCLEKVVSAAFSQRRKTLRNTLKEFLLPDEWSSLEIDPTLRAEALTLQTFLKLAEHVLQKNAAKA